MSDCQRPDCDRPSPHLHGDEFGHRDALRALLLAGVVRHDVDMVDVLIRPLDELVRDDMVDAVRTIMEASRRPATCVPVDPEP
jgi:hypothetical protein